MGDDRGYNGWKNYETWNVALWIDNEPWTNDYRRQMCRDSWADGRVGNALGERDTAVRVFADSLKDWVSDELMPDLGPCLASDLLGAALSEVDWDEIAEAWIDEDAPEPDEAEQDEDEEGDQQQALEGGAQ